jgi:hypothetical protein
VPDYSLAACWPGFSHDHSLVINTSGGAPPAYMSSDFVVNNTAAVGFVNAPGADAGGDYHGYALSSASAFKGRASDGTDPGVDFAALDAALGPRGRVAPRRPRRRLGADRRDTDTSQPRLPSVMGPGGIGAFQAACPSAPAMRTAKSGSA